MPPSARPVPTRAPVLCLEGPSVVPELDAAGAPPVAASAAWYAERSAARWQDAWARAAAAPLVVLDGDPFKGIWYGWVFAGRGWPGRDA